MVDIITIINGLGNFIKDAVVDNIPLGAFLILSLIVGGILKITHDRVKGGK